jgi:hypothetical protein
MIKIGSVFVRCVKLVGIVVIVGVFGFLCCCCLLVGADHPTQKNKLLI